MAYSNVQTGTDANGNPILSSGSGDAPAAVTSPAAPTATLTQAQLDAQNAALGRTQFNTGPITSAGLAGTTPITPVTPSTTPTPNISGLATYTPQTLTPEETQLQQRINEAAQGNTDLAGEAAYQTDQNNAAGVNQIQQAINDNNTAVKQFQDSVSQAKISSESGLAGPRFLVSAEQAQIDRQSASKALTLSSLSDALANNLVAAQAKADQAVAAKYGPLEAAQKAKLANLDLLLKDPALSLADKNRAAAQQVIEQNNAATLAQQKADATAVQTAAINATTYAQNFTPTAQYPTLSSALNAIASATSSVTAAQIASSVGLTAAAKLDTSVIEAGGRKLLVNNQTGATVKDLGAATTGGGVGTPIRSGTLNYSAQDQADDSKSLNASRGTDGYVDPNLYLKLYNAWINAGGQLEDFLKTYPPVNYINPANTFLPKFLMPKATSAFEQF